MLNYIEVDYQSRIIAGRVYRISTVLEIPLENLPNLDKMLSYFEDRVHSRLDVQALNIQKGLISEEKAEIYLFICFGEDERTKSLFTAWKTLEWQLSSIGSPKLINIDIQELSIQLGQPNGLIEQVKKFLDTWGILIELVLLLIIIGILLTEKKK